MLEFRYTKEMQKTFAITILLALTFVFVVSIAFAETIEIKNPLGEKDFKDLINTILKIIFNVALAIVPLMVVIGGFMFVSAGGKPEQVAKARNLLLWTAVGFVVILSARGLTKILLDLLKI